MSKLCLLDKCKTLTAFPCHQAASERLKGKVIPVSPERRFDGLKKTWTIIAKKAVNGGLDGAHPYAQRKSRYMKQKPPRHPRVVLRETVAREHRDIQELARKYAKAGMEIAVEIMADKTAPASARLQAIELIENRAYGKPQQTNTNLNVNANGKNSDVSSTELDARIDSALKRVEELAGRAPKATARKKQPADLRKLDRDPHGPNEPVH